jgi:hypothetical protein
MSEEPLMALLKGCPEEGKVFRHRSGHEYEVVGCCIDEGTLSPHVLYRGKKDGKVVWSRPLAEWVDKFEEVTHR